MDLVQIKGSICKNLRLKTQLAILDYVGTFYSDNLLILS